MINLDINTNSIEQEFNLSQRDVDGLLQYVVEDVATEFARHWETEAKSSLRQSRSLYVNAINVAKRGQFASVVYLNPAAWLPNAIEMGHGEFDMKKGLLNSKKVKYTKKGKPYITVPFRFGVPSTIGDSTAFAGIMPKAIHNVVKRQAPGESLKMGDISSQYKIPKSVALRNQVKSGIFTAAIQRSEKTSIYKGMQKTEGGYVTFRRVSLASDSDRWIHPGFQAKNLAAQALSRFNLPQAVDVSIDNYLSKLGF